MSLSAAITQDVPASTPSRPQAETTLPRRRRSILSGWRSRLVTAAIVLASGLLLTEFVAASYAETVRHQRREEAVLAAAATRARLENALDSTMFVAQGLVAYIRSVDRISPARATEALRAVVEANPHIRNVGLAPANVLTYIYPLKGNEAALNLDFRTLPRQWPSVERAMALRQSVLAGPVDLVQGGRAIICRTPVFLADGSYWGVISVVIDLDKLLSDIQLEATVDGMVYYLQGDNAGAADAGVAILGSPELTRDDPVRMQLDVPGGRWTLLAVPSRGWNVSGPRLTAVWLAGAGLSLLCAWFVWMLMIGRAVARRSNGRLAEINQQLNAANRRLAEINRQDELTGVANRRHFDEAYARDWALCRRQRVPLSVLMIDLDRFKQINDSHGHAVGDVCLAEAARRLSGGVRRAGDLLARYGGEEFVVVSPGLSHTQAIQLAQHLRVAVNAACNVPGKDGTLAVPMSVSIGVATIVPGAAAAPEDLLKVADAALYRAKQNGRNRVESASPPPKLLLVGDAAGQTAHGVSPRRPPLQ